MHVLKSKYYKQMTIKSRDMEIPILVFWLSSMAQQFHCPEFCRVSVRKKSAPALAWHFINNGLYQYLEANNMNL